MLRRLFDPDLRLVEAQDALALRAKGTRVTALTATDVDDASRRAFDSCSRTH